LGSEECLDFSGHLQSSDRGKAAAAAMNLAALAGAQEYGDPIADLYLE
jgi:hypothetical protein